MSSPDQKVRARSFLRCVLPVAVVTVVAVLGFAFWFWEGGGAWRGSVDIVEARVSAPNTLEIQVSSCNGAPRLWVQRQTGDTLELEVVAYSTPLRGGEDCLDLVTLQVDEPVTTIVDLHSGETTEVTR